MNYLDIELGGVSGEGILKRYKLSDFSGKNIIVYFYPHDDTPVCIQEAEEFRNSYEELSGYAVIIGVSPDTQEAHADFKNKYGLNFILLSDTENQLKNAFKNHSRFITNLHRGTFIINKKGEIVKYWDKVDVDGHIGEIKDFFKSNGNISAF